MRRLINGKWEKIKRGQVIAPSADNCKARLTAYNDLAYTLLTSKVDPNTYNNYGNLIKRKNKTNKANLWKNGHVSNAYKDFHKIERKKVEKKNKYNMAKIIYTTN